MADPVKFENSNFKFLQQNYTGIEFSKFESSFVKFCLWLKSIRPSLSFASNEGYWKKFSLNFTACRAQTIFCVALFHKLIFAERSYTQINLMAVMVLLTTTTAGRFSFSSSCCILFALWGGFLSCLVWLN